MARKIVTPQKGLDSFPMRRTVIYCQSEPLPLAPAPIVDEISGKTITLDRIMPALLPGVLALSERARYLAIFPFLLSLYEERRLAADNASLGEFIRLQFALEPLRGCHLPPHGSRNAPDPPGDRFLVAPHCIPARALPGVVPPALERLALQAQPAPASSPERGSGRAPCCRSLRRASPESITSAM